MHLANAMFWEYVGDTYSKYIKDGLVYEFGSHSVNDDGNLRRITESAKNHIGIDWRPGPSVDHVSLAHDVNFDEEADVILSASMLEHDPYYELSLSNMVRLLKPGGLIAISWGAALNPLHCEDHSPDGRFLPLKAEIVTNILRALGVDIVEFLYEGFRYPGIGGMGEVALVGFKGTAPSDIERKIDDFLIEDLS